MSRLETIWLLITAAVCGAVVMAIELLGARLLGVTYGGSLVVWAAMIAVTLLSLAIGYFAGGYMSDRLPKASVLYWILIVTAVLLAVCPYAKPVIRSFHQSLGLRAGALASSVTLFSLPLVLLGMVSPFIIRLLCAEGKGIGIRAGGAYAISTLGSVAGTLLTGLWMIPSVGTMMGFRITAIATAVVAVVGLVLASGKRPLVAAVVPVAMLFLPAGAGRIGERYTAPDGDRVEVKAVRESPHGHLVVLDKGKYRLLVVNGIIQTGIPLSATAMSKGQGLSNKYYQELLAYTVDDPAKTSALIIGLAGGMTASLLRQHDMELDCVDLDPEVIKTAREFFRFEGNAEAADGRIFMEQCRKKYDFCIIDTYSGDSFPFHLATREAFAASKQVLNPGGILALNYIGAPGGRAFACIYKTLEAVFPNVLAINGEPGSDVQTITVFASDRKIEFNKGWLELSGTASGVDPVSRDIERFTTRPDMADAFMLTDDYNPIDFLRGGEALRWRERTARNIGEQALLW